MMRYVYKSTNEKYCRFGLYFGPMRKQYDRLEYLQRKMTKHDFMIKCPTRGLAKMLQAAKEDKSAPKNVQRGILGCLK